VVTVGSQTGHGYVCGQVANVNWARTRRNCGRVRGLNSATANLWPLSVHGLDTARMRARTDHGRGCGLGTATASRPDSGADIVRLNRDPFADIRTLKVQGVRRPLCNPHKSCGHSRINMPASYCALFGMFRHRAETLPEVPNALTGRSCTRSGTKQVGSGMNGRRCSGAWVRNGR
jgi:hypothetical protein